MDYPFGLVPEFNEMEQAIAELEEGWARAALALRTGSRFGHKGEVLCRRIADVHHELEARRERYYKDKGGAMELLHAVQCCARENLPMPLWLALAFDDTFSKFLQSGTTLDAAFSSTNLPTTAKKANTARRDWQRGVPIWQEVREIANQHAGLDSALRKVLAGGTFKGIGLTKARKLVETIDALQVSAMKGMRPLSQIFMKPRKHTKEG